VEEEEVSYFDLFNYVWYGDRMLYYLDDEYFEDQCSGKNCKKRDEVFGFPMIQSGMVHRTRRICG